MTLHFLVTVGQIFLNSIDIQCNLNNNKDHYLYCMKQVFFAMFTMSYEKTRDINFKKLTSLYCRQQRYNTE